MTLSCPCPGAPAWLEALVVMLAVIGVAAGFLMLRRGCGVGIEDRASILSAFAAMDELDAREAEDAEYAESMAALSGGLPSWASAMAIERLADKECPSRRRYLEVLRRSRIVEERERLVEIAKDVTDPLAGEVWSMLTGRPAGEWAKALVASDGGQDEKKFLARAEDA